MNRIHRTVWNPRRGAYMVAAETTRSRGKASGASGALLAGVLMGAVGAAMPVYAAGPAAAALPTGGQVTAGQAQIATAGSTLTVTQGSAKAAINWGSFSIGKDATVQFVQPNASAVALNRVTGSEGSVIDGALSANGQVFILNPNGVLFGKGARVDTAGLVATTLGLSDADFLAGKTGFTGHGGAVINQGSLTARDGGYIALIGQQVKNDGTITARLGTVALAAGDKVSLNFNGDSLVGVAIDQGALDALVANGGAIRADGGLVVLTAQGAEGLVNTLVNNTGEVRAQTVENKAGRIYLLGEGGKVEVAGTLDASAPAGNGGFIETSGAKVHIADTTSITTEAAHGASGTWLVDPTDFTIAASGGNITGTVLGNQLLTTNVAFQSSSGAAGTGGDINVNAAVSWSAHTLTLTAARDINVNAVMTVTGTAGLDLEPATANGSSTAVTGGAVNMGLTASGFTGRVDFNSSGALTIGGAAYTVIHLVGTAASSGDGTLQGIVGDLTGHYALGSDINASATGNQSWNSGTGFTPLGGNGTPFTGVLNGLGHTINALTVDSTNQNSGLLGVLGTAGILTNLAAANLSSTCDAGSCGGLVGTLGGKASNLWVNGSLTTPGNFYYAGLLAAKVDATATLTNAYVSGHADFGADTRYGGGAVGRNLGILSGVHSTAVITGDSNTSYIGGVVGFNLGTVTGSSYVGTIDLTDSATNIGGLVGGNDLGAVVTSSTASVVMNLGDSAQYVGGLVGYSSGATMTSNTVSATITAGFDASDVGLLSGYADSSPSIDGNHVSGSITIGPTSSGRVGGLVGEVFGSTISNSSAQVTIHVGETATAVGGLVGDGHDSVITNSQASGALILTDTVTNVGGLVGKISLGGSISNSRSSVTVSVGDSATNVGGLVGLDTRANLSNVSSSGAVTAGDDATAIGGLIGAAFGGAPPPTISHAYATGNVAVGVNGIQIGGLMGYAGVIVLDTAFATGDVQTANAGTQTGGLIGFAEGPTLSNVYATGSVTATTNFDAIGGLIGYIAGGSLTNVYSSGLVTVDPNSNARVGGLIGADDQQETISHSFWNAATTGRSTSAGSGAIGLTTAQFRHQANYNSATTANGNVNPGWDFSNDWVMYDGLTAPLLRAFMTPLTISVSPTKIYDGTVLGGLAHYSVTPDVSHLSGLLVMTGAGRNVGSYNVVPSGLYSDQLGYIISFVGGSLTVQPATLTVTATGGTQVYNGTTAATVTLASNSFNGDVVSLADASATLANKNVGNGKAVSVTGISISGADAGNYVLANTTASTTTDVTQATLTVSATGGTQVYNGTTAAAVTLGGGFLGDQLTFSDTSAVLANKNVGTNKLVSVAGIAVTGADAGNYVLANTTASTTTDVTPATLTVSATGGTQVYNGTAAANVALASNAFNGDVVSLSDTSATLADKNVGTGKAVSISGIAVTGADAGNYVLANTTASTTTNVTPATLTVSATGGTQVYNSSTAAAVTLGSNAFNGDVLTLADASATLADKNVGTNKAVSVTGIAVSGADAGNYVLANTTASTTTNVTPATLTVSATGGTQVYNGTTAAAVTLGSNAFSGDVVSLSDASAALADKNVGSNKAVSVTGIAVSGTDAGNYVLANTTASTTASITPRTLNLSFSVADKTFDGSTAGSATASDNRVSGDQLSAQFSAAYADTNTGAAKPVAITGLVLTGADAANYQVASNAGSGVTGNLLTRGVTYTLAAQDPSKTYTATGQVLVSAAALDQLVVARFANTVAGTSPGALSYAIYRNGVQVSSIAEAGTYEIRASFATTDAHYALAGTGNSALTIVVAAAAAVTPPPATANPPPTTPPPATGATPSPTVAAAPAQNSDVIGQAVRTEVPVSTAAVVANAGVGAPRSLVDFSAMPPNVATSPAALTAAFGAGVPLSLLSSPSGAEPSQAVTLAQASQMITTSSDNAEPDRRDVRVPVSRNSLAQIVNGGVKLPGGVDQLLFVVKADK